MAEQLIFDLPHRQALGREDFLVADSNRNAISAIDTWPDWGAHIALICGPQGTGKSHILNVWRLKTQAVFLAADDLHEDKIESTLHIPAAHFALDDLDHILCEPLHVQNGLFHLLNAIKNRGGTFLATSRTVPKELPVTVPDLQSRLKSAVVFNIEAPDDDLLFALWVKQFHDRQLKIEPDVIKFLMLRCERSFAALGKTVEKIDAASLKEKRRITLPFIKKVLDI